VTGGNVSLYNQTGSNAIRPTPVIGVLGVHDDVRKRLGVGFPAEEARVVLLGTTSEEFGGSAWADVVHQHLGGRPPAVDLEAERNLAALIAAAAAEGVLASAHDLSDGGLGVALAESCLRGGVGCWISLGGFDNRAGVSVDAPADAFTALFSESAGRALVSVRPGREDDFADLCDEHGVPATVLGRTGGESLTVVNAFEVPLADLDRVWTATLPALFG
jgi:phosphoribosylformylglycinamidine synthase subunit PurL